MQDKIGGIVKWTANYVNHFCNHEQIFQLSKISSSDLFAV